MTKPSAADVVVADFYHELRLQRLPFGRALGAPAARPRGSIAGEPRCPNERCQLLGQRGTLLSRDRGGKAYMIELALIVIEAQQPRAHDLTASAITKATDDATARPQTL